MTCSAARFCSLVIVAAVILLPGSAAEAAGAVAQEAGAIAPGVEGVIVATGCLDGEVHDDGTVENGYGWNSASVTTGVILEKFTPPSYPWSYDQVCIGLTRTGTDDSFSYRIAIYDDDGPAGAPGTLLTAVPVTDSGVPSWTDTAIYDHDVRGHFPVIMSGSVYIGAYWSPGIEQSFYLTADETVTTPLSGGYGWNDNDGIWETLDYWWGGYRAMFIRASGSPAGELVGCPFADTAGDNLDRGYYVPSYPGLSLDQVTMHFITATAGAYTIRLTARAEAYDGPIVGVAEVTADLAAGATPVDFLFGGAPTPPFVPLTFDLDLLGGPGTVYFDTGPCNFGGCTSCQNIIETNGTTPPLSTVRRRSVAVSIYGRGALVFADDFEHACPTPWSGSAGFVLAPWSCPPGSAGEGEACPVNGTDPLLDPNGGCNSVPPSFGVITMGGTVCGTTGTYVTSTINYRDTDWFSFTVVADGYFRISGGGEQQLQFFAIDRTNCGAPLILASGVSEAGCQTSFVVWLETGTYAVFVAPTVFAGVPCAPATRDYWVGIEPAAEP